MGTFYFRTQVSFERASRRQASRRGCLGLAMRIVESFFKVAA